MSVTEANSFNNDNFLILLTALFYSVKKNPMSNNTYHTLHALESYKFIAKMKKKRKRYDWQLTWRPNSLKYDVNEFTQINQQFFYHQY